MVAGGQDAPNNYVGISSAQTYNPAHNAWTTTGSLNTARGQFAMTLLLVNRRVELLAAGGFSCCYNFYSSAELYDTGVSF